MSPVTLCALPAVTAVYDVTLDFRGNKTRLCWGSCMGRSTGGHVSDRYCRRWQGRGRAGGGGGRWAGRDQASVHLLRLLPLSRMPPRGGAGAFHPLGPSHGGARTEQRRLREVQAEGSRSSKGGVIPPWREQEAFGKRL